MGSFPHGRKGTECCVKETLLYVFVMTVNFQNLYRSTLRSILHDYKPIYKHIVSKGNEKKHTPNYLKIFIVKRRGLKAREQYK